jgi:hypothetical protein
VQGGTGGAQGGGGVLGTVGPFAPSRWVHHPWRGVSSSCGAPDSHMEPPKTATAGQRMAENSIGPTDGPPPVPKEPIRPGAAVLGRAARLKGPDSTSGCASERPRCDFRLRV